MWTVKQQGFACAQAFLSASTDKNKWEIKEALMPDSMHPSAVGMRIIATRLEPLIAQLLKEIQEAAMLAAMAPQGLGADD